MNKDLKETLEIMKENEKTLKETRIKLAQQQFDKEFEKYLNKKG